VKFHHYLYKIPLLNPQLTGILIAVGHPALWEGNFPDINSEIVYFLAHSSDYSDIS
jgi:hypothetical protein